MVKSASIGGRLDAQAAVRPDRGGLDDEAHRQRGDDRRNAQRLDQRVVDHPDADADRQRDRKPGQDHAVLRRP